MGLHCFVVGIGGFIGAVSRYLLGFIPVYYYLDYPLGTMLINFIGAFCIGILAGIAPREVLSEQQLLLWKTGFCGGFTTFSTFSLETVQLLEQGHECLAGAYVLSSVAICLLGVYLGKLLVAMLVIS